MLQSRSTGSQVRPPVPRVSRALRVAAAVMLVVILALTGQQLMQQRRAALEEETADLSRLAAMIAEHTGNILAAADAILREVAASPDAAAGLDGDWIRRLAVAMPQLQGVVLLDPSGHAVQRSAGSALAGLPEIPLAWSGSSPTASGIGGMIHRPDGGWTLPVSRRLQNGAILVALLDLEALRSFYQKVSPPGSGTIALHQRNGATLLRVPQDNAFLGKNPGALAPFRDVQAGAGSASAIVDLPEGAGERVLVVRALPGFPLLVSVSASVDDVLRPWRQRAGTILLTGLAAVAVIGALLLMLATENRQVEALLNESAAARDAAEHANAMLNAQIDERERTEVALRQAQRLEAVGQLTGGVAHDFNNLLTVLLGNIDLLQSATKDGTEHAARLDRMRAAAERGAQLIDQLLAFARRQPLVPHPTSLNAVISGMTDLIQSAMGGNIRIVLRLHDAPWPALVDATQIELVMLNLAINARDAMQKGGTLTIETANISLETGEPEAELPSGDYVVVRVSDTGIGMSTDIKAKAFEPFFTTKPPGQGSGLGLSQVYGFARQSGGGVRIDSKPDHGTMISVYLPRAPASLGRVMRDDRLSSPSVTAGARILLVDDDEAVRMTTAMILESLGYVIETAKGGETALNKLTDHAATPGPGFDLLLTDVAMPGMNGPELAERVHARYPGLPVVFFSGYADPDAVAGRQILQRMVRKPFRASDLAAQIEAALSGHVSPSGSA